jgi:hypothetical protein
MSYHRPPGTGGTARTFSPRFCQLPFRALAFFCSGDSQKIRYGWDAERLAVDNGWPLVETHSSKVQFFITKIIKASYRRHALQ